MVILSRFKPVDGAFEPAVIVFTIVIVLGIAWVVWEFWLRDK
jgi:hypothetical protein